MNHEQIETCIRLIAKLQSALYEIDELEGTGMYVHELKKKTNTYSRFLENRLNNFYIDMDLQKSSEFIEIVNSINSSAKEIKLTIE